LRKKHLILTFFKNLKITSSIGSSEKLTTELLGFYLINASDGFDYIGKSGLKIEKTLQA